MTKIFQDSIKKLIYKNVRQNVSWLIKENPDLKTRLNIPLEHCSIEEEVYSLAVFNKFVEDNRLLIRSKYNALVKPMIQLVSSGSEDIEKSLFLYFLDDFYSYAIYKCVESDDVAKTFEEAWSMFESDFFATENKVELLARLKNVYFQGGIVLSDVMPWDNTDVFWARSAFDYRMLGWNRKGSRLYEFLDTFQPSWIVMRKNCIVSNVMGIHSGIKEATNEFNLFTFVVRSELGGSVYFNDIRIFGLGHYSPDSGFGANWKAVMENDIYEDFDEFTTIDNPWDYFLSKAMKKIDSRLYEDYSFADWQARISETFRFSSRVELTETRKLYHLYNQLLNASFVLNSLLPDIDNNNRKNAEFRKDYFPPIMASVFKIDENMVRDNILKCYEIRGEIAHGKYKQALSLVHALGSLDNFIQLIRFFRNLINRLILLSLVNPDLKSKLEAYYMGKDTSILPTLVKPYE